MSGNATTTATPQESYGSSAVKNRVRPGGDLGTNQYYYKTTATGPQAGEIEVYRWSKVGRASSSTTKIGKIRPGGTFEVESKANGDPVANTSEILHYADKSNVSKARLQATKVATKEWDGKTQPPPNQAINGKWKPPVDDPVKNPQQATKSNPTKGSRLSSSGDKSEKIQKPTNSSLGAGKFLVYPIAMRRGNNAQDYIKLQMLQYSPKKMVFSETNLSGVGGRQKNRKGLGSAYLPIPGGIADSNMADWGGQTMDPAAMALAQAAYSTVMEGVSAGGAKAQEIVNAAQGNAGETKKAIGTAIASSASKTGAQLLQRTTGEIINPNMELLFNGPQLRNFQFSWKLAPRGRKEAEEVVKILRFFKQGMAPIREAPNLFLKSPNTWKISYHHKNSDHKYLNQFKECALVNCGVQYTPDGNYSTYEDGVMTAYQMTLSFQELDPVYSDDYSDIPTNEIGF